MTDYPIVRQLLSMPCDRESRAAFSAAAGTLGCAGLRSGMLGFAWPARISVRAVLPRLPDGKIDRRRMFRGIESGRSGS